MLLPTRAGCLLGVHTVWPCGLCGRPAVFSGWLALGEGCLPPKRGGRALGLRTRRACLGHPCQQGRRLRDRESALLLSKEEDGPWAFEQGGRAWAIPSSQGWQPLNGESVPRHRANVAISGVGHTMREGAPRLWALVVSGGGISVMRASAPPRRWVIASGGRPLLLPAVTAAGRSSIASSCHPPTRPSHRLCRQEEAGRWEALLLAATVFHCPRHIPHAVPPATKTRAGQQHCI